MTDYQREILDRVHGFADEFFALVTVLRGQNEDSPTAVIAQAADAGLYSWDGITTCECDLDGLLTAMVAEELSAVDAVLTLVLLGTMLPVAARIANGNSEQIERWSPCASAHPRPPWSPSPCPSRLKCP